MKLTRLAAAAMALGLVSFIGAGAANAATTVTTAQTPASLVTVKWKTTATAAITAYGDWTSSASAVSTNATPGTIITAGAPAAGGSCGTAGASTANTVDFGSIAPDGAVTEACMYEHAVAATVVTNSTAWTVTQTLSAAVPAGFTLCGVPYANQTALPLTYAAASQTTTCTAANTIGTTAVNFGSGAGTTTGSTYLSEDLNLIVAANANEVTQAPTLTLTLIAT